LVSVRVLLPIAFYDVAVIPPTLRYDEMLTILILKLKHDGKLVIEDVIH